ncbi:7 alpha-cephem-methoxylase [Penicillium macrosclerotiorum]|uniref:7 alpha-cephem-methoxylase n=1 Tax=Penicillium macrosclerotiorum TaxID=303699 RepID=UPI002547DD19|nr:7 alpha-cephem-methoxylase [Penicillium macrosclerotiorum]KAJ5679286.1 7 alpha-cephem-methoxylase [Penicillium macrosclerotiorum]
MPGTQHTRFNYFKWDPKFEFEKPYFMLMDTPEDFPQCNYDEEPGPIESVHDIRGQFERYNLDDNGFIARVQPLATTNFVDETVKSLYLPSLEKLLKDNIGSECELFWFDWRVRSSDREKTYVPAGVDVELDDKSMVLEPIHYVHVGAAFPSVSLHFQAFLSI